MIYLLDTNVVLAYLREPNPTQQVVDRDFAPLSAANDAVISVVTVGEIKALAIKNGWGKARISRIEVFLNQAIIADINTDDIINRYAEIDAFSQGRLPSKASNFSARNMGKNDIWIAATTSVLGAVLLTTDDDFEHLHEEFLQVARVELSN